MSRKIEITTLVMEFLEVAIHQIIYVKNIYPKGIFVTKKKYGVPVHVSNFQNLNEYINKSLSSIKFIIDKEELHDVYIYFFSPNNKPLERIVFSIDKILTGFRDLGTIDPYLIELRETFRAFCLKLSISANYTKELPEGTTFKICMNTNESMSYLLSEDPQQKEFPWYMAENREITFENGTITPIRTVEHEFMCIHVYCEENK